MARRESKDTSKTKGQKTTPATGRGGNNRAKNRGYKTAERERRVRSDRKRLCRLGRDYAIVPDIGAVGDENASSRRRRR